MLDTKQSILLFSGQWPASLARVHLVGSGAGLALDVAAPVELAVAALFYGHSLGVVASKKSKKVIFKVFKITY